MWADDDFVQVFLRDSSRGVLFSRQRGDLAVGNENCFKVHMTGFDCVIVMTWFDVIPAGSKYISGVGWFLKM